MLIILAGPSTVGKNYLCDLAEKRGHQFVVPTTTRSARHGEVNGKDYYFISNPEFQEEIRAGKFCEWDYVLGNYYGDNLRDVEKAILSPDVWFLHALAKICVRMKPRYGKGVHTVLLTPSEPGVLGLRLQERGYAGEELWQRQLHGTDELAHANLMDQVVVGVDSKVPGVVLDDIIYQARRTGSW